MAASEERGRSVLWGTICKQDLLSILCAHILVCKYVVGHDSNPWRLQRGWSERMPARSRSQSWPSRHYSQNQLPGSPKLLSPSPALYPSYRLQLPNCFSTSCKAKRACAAHRHKQHTGHKHMCCNSCGTCRNRLYLSSRSKKLLSCCMCSLKAAA